MASSATKKLQYESFILGVKIGMMTGRGQDPLNRFDIDSVKILKKEIIEQLKYLNDLKKEGLKEPSKKSFDKEVSEWLKVRDESHD